MPTPALHAGPSQMPEGGPGPFKSGLWRLEAEKGQCIGSKEQRRGFGGLATPGAFCSCRFRIHMPTQVTLLLTEKWGVVCRTLSVSISAHIGGSA